SAMACASSSVAREYRSSGGVEEPQKTQTDWSAVIPVWWPLATSAVVVRPQKQSSRRQELPTIEAGRHWNGCRHHGVEERDELIPRVGIAADRLERGIAVPGPQSAV